MRTHPAPTAQQQDNSKSPPRKSLPNVPIHVLTSLSVVMGATNASQEERDLHVHALASYFASSVSYDSKLARLRTLMTLITPEDASWQLGDSVLKDTLRFLTDRNFDWPYPEHSAQVVLLELRAMCLHENERRSLIVKGGEVAAECIVGAARLVEHGLASSVPLIHGGLDLAGGQLKNLLTPEKEPLLTPRDLVVTRTYTEAAKRATNGVRETARWTAHSIRDASTDSIHWIAQRFDQEQLGETLIPNEGHRNVLVAAGTVGIASLGAAAIVGEAVFETTKAVYQKSASVTADVVRYKYGESAGQIVEDASHTTGNILRTLAHVAMLETTVLAKAVGKNVCKIQAQRSQEGDESLVENNSLGKVVSPESYQCPVTTTFVEQMNEVKTSAEKSTTGNGSPNALGAIRSEPALPTTVTPPQARFAERLLHSFDSSELEDIELNVTQHNDGT